jgi:hypothetical protein
MSYVKLSELFLFGHCNAAQRAEEAVSHPHQEREDIRPEAGFELVKR